MQSLLDAQVRRQLHERFRATAWMGPVGNVAAALVWAAAFARMGVGRTTLVVWFALMMTLCALMAAAYLAPSSFRWTDGAGIPYLTLVALGSAGLLWGSTLWLDGPTLAEDKYIYGTLAVLLGLVSGAMVASSGVARVTGVMLVPMGLAALAALARDGLWVEAAGLVVLGAILTPVQIESAAGIRELLMLRLASEEAACRDPLTGLLNRRGLSEALRQIAPQQPVTVLFADLDRFKAVNDMFGHDVGDAVLCNVAELLTIDLPDKALVSRFGGDEFVAVVPDLDVTANDVIRHVRTTVHPELEVVGPRAVTMSLGLAEGLAHEVEASLLTEADRRMFIAKRQRRAEERQHDLTVDLLDSDSDGPHLDLIGPEPLAPVREVEH